MAKRLTEPQQRLLAEIRESSTGGLFIDEYSRYSRTAAVLVREELVTKNWEYGTWYWYEPVSDQAPPHTPLLAGRIKGTNEPSKGNRIRSSASSAWP